MKIRFIAEITDEQGKLLKVPVNVETEVPEITEFENPEDFYETFDKFEKPVIEARNQIAQEITKDYLEEIVFLKEREKSQKS